MNNEEPHQTTSIPRGSTPVPDPTVLTTLQLNREIEAVKGELTAKFEANYRLLVARLEERDKAVNLAHETIQTFPRLIDEKILALRELHQEKFQSIEIQFKEREVRTETSARDSKIAVDAALQAAKEAVSEQNRSAGLAIQKSETATIKQIDQQGLLIATATKAIDDKINDLKDRTTRIEGLKTGVGQAWGVIVAVVGVGIAIAGILYKPSGGDVSDRNAVSISRLEFLLEQHLKSNEMQPRQMVIPPATNGR